MKKTNNQTDLLKRAVDLAHASDLGAVLTVKQFKELQVLVYNANKTKAQLSGVAHGLNGHSLGTLFSDKTAPEAPPKVKAPAQPQKECNGKPRRWELLTKKEYVSFCDSFESWSKLRAELGVCRTTLLNWYDRGTIPTLKNQEMLVKAIAAHNSN